MKATASEGSKDLLQICVDGGGAPSCVQKE